MRLSMAWERTTGIPWCTNMAVIWSEGWVCGILSKTHRLCRTAQVPCVHSSEVQSCNKSTPLQYPPDLLLKRKLTFELVCLTSNKWPLRIIFKFFLRKRLQHKLKGEFNARDQTTREKLRAYQMLRIRTGCVDMHWMAVSCALMIPVFENKLEMDICKKITSIHRELQKFQMFAFSLLWNHVNAATQSHILITTESGPDRVDTHF